MINARTPRRAFFIERACFFDTCGAEKIKDVGSAKGSMPEKSWMASLIRFLNPGEITQRFFSVGFYCAFHRYQYLETFILRPLLLSAALHRSVNASTGGDLSLLKGRAFRKLHRRKIREGRGL